MKIICPYCMAELEGEESLLGQKVQCPTCNKTFIAMYNKKQEAQRNVSCSTSRSSQTSITSSGRHVSMFAIVVGGVLLLVLVLGGIYCLRIFGTDNTAPQKFSAVTVAAPTAPPSISAKSKEALEQEVERNQSNTMLKKALMFKRHGLNADAKRIIIELIYERGALKEKATALHLLGMIEFEENNIGVALTTWKELIAEYPESPEAILIKDKIKTLTQIVGDAGKEYIDNAVAESYLQNGRFWSRGRDTIFSIDTSWISNLDAAIKWYDKVIAEFPGTSAARIAYEEKMRTLKGWKEPGEYGESYGVKENPNKYLPLLVQTFNEYEKNFPNASALNGFRFQIAQIYWGRSDQENTKKWLALILNSPQDSFYKDLAVRRLNAPVPQMKYR